MKILCTSHVMPDIRNVNTILIHRIISSLKKRIPLEVIWIIYQPERINPIKNSFKSTYVKDIHDYNNSLEILEREKPDVIITTNDIGSIPYSLALAAQKNNILTITCFQYTFNYIQNVQASHNQTSWDQLKKLFSNNIPSDQIQNKKQFIRRGRFFLYKYLFIVRTYLALKLSPSQIIKNIIRDIKIFMYNKYLFNKNIKLNFLNNKDWVEPLLKLGYDKSSLIITGDPIFDERLKFHKSVNKLKKSQVKILIITDSLVEHGIWTKTKRDLLLINLIDKIRKIKTTKIGIKIHPSSESLEEYKKLILKIDNSIVLYQSEILFDLFDEYDLVISYGSTGAHEDCIINGIPLILLDLNFKIPIFQFVQKAINAEIVSVCTSLDNLPEIIQEMIIKKPIIDERLKKFMNDMKIDGKASDRIADKILETFTKRN